MNSNDLDKTQLIMWGDHQGGTSRTLEPQVQEDRDYYARKRAENRKRALNYHFFVECEYDGASRANACANRRCARNFVCKHFILFDHAHYFQLRINKLANLTIYLLPVGSEVEDRRCK